MLVKRVVFALQKYGFCRAKRWFLHCKKWVFVLLTINIRGTTTVLVLYEHYVTANCSPRNWQSVSSRRGRFIVPVYTCSPHIRKTLGHICNPFETHLCNVRNVFVICVLHIRRVKVWFLRCKSMGFSMQKPHF